MRRKVFVAAIIVVLLFLGALFMSRFSFTALNEPGRVETYLATQAKHVLISRSARNVVPPAPADATQSPAEGEKFYGVECSMCHGVNGHTPTDSGRWMYPRAADLTSAEVQSWSDPQLFWIIRNGIKFSGMPAFAKVESDEHIWNLVHYVRVLPNQKTKKEN